MSAERNAGAAPAEGLVEQRQALPYCLIDRFPCRVPERESGQVFAVERWYLEEERLTELYRKFADLLLRLNSYYDFRVGMDPEGDWERNPDPETLTGKILSCAQPGHRMLHILFDDDRSLADLSCQDLYMTVYGLSEEARMLLEKLAGAEGLFLWSPDDQ